MKERPILFSAPMVRAILEGRKTQTRRTIKLRPPYVMAECDYGGSWPYATTWAEGDAGTPWMPSPYGGPWDVLWVKETHGFHSYLDETNWLRESIRGWPEDDLLVSWKLAYAADWGPHQEDCFWRPAIFMRRWMSRITLEITDVRAERLQDISEDDARAEGAPLGEATDGGKCHVLGFLDIWERINGAGSWDANPWVWAVSFKVVTP